MPYGRISQVRFEVLEFFPGPSQSPRGLSADSHTPRSRLVCPRPSFIFRPGISAGSESGNPVNHETTKSQSPFAPCRCYLRGRDVDRLFRGHYTSVFAAGSEEAHKVALVLASVRHPDCTYRFPVCSYREDASLLGRQRRN